MRVAALYDIHGNLPALEAVLADVQREGVDALVIGGDFAAGPMPVETFDRLRALGDESPAEVVEADYRLQRLVYALACLRAGSDQVEVVYQFLERPEAPVEAVFSQADVPELEAELSAAIARIQAGEFPPTPGDFACAGCPALDLVCAGPRLRSRPAEVVAS